jgi:hypothetical protein
VPALVQRSLDQAGHPCLPPPGAVGFAQQVSHRAVGRKDEGDVVSTVVCGARFGSGKGVRW